MDNSRLEALVKKSQKGDTGAIEELLRISYTPVSYQCRRFLKTGQDAEDMTQEILLLLYTKLDTLKEPAAYWGWLGRMTANRCKNALTRTQENLPLLEDGDGNSILDVMENEDRQTIPEEAFDNAETARMIGGIVDALPDAQRDCILLYYYDEMSIKEIAGVTGTSENTVKSRLNYARRTIRENVLAYEKEQGIRLHSLAPIPLLLYFLRMSAEESVDTGKAQKAVSAVMEKGAAASTGAVAGSAVSTAQSAVSHALQGISIRTAALAAAGLLLAGGAAAGIITAASRSREEAVETSMPTEIVEENKERITEEAPPEAAPEEAPAEAAATPEEAPADTAGAPPFPAETLAVLPYTGDIGGCAMTAAQADAFAGALEECNANSVEAGYQQQPFCRGALFDTGGGIPALFVVWGYDMGYGDESGYMPNVSRIYCWDGRQAVAAVESRPLEEAIFSEDISNIAVTDHGLILSRVSWEGGICTEVSELYSLPDGLTGGKPDHIYEEFVFWSPDIPAEGEYRDGITGQGAFGSGYDFGSLSESNWQYYPEYGESGGRWRETGGWLLAALDGKFLTADEAAESRKLYAWYEADWKLGHGEKWATDVSHFWTGGWMDARELVDLLRGGGNAGGTEDAADMAEAPAEDTPAVAGTLPENATVDMDGNIQRTTLDSRGYDIEVYYEAPIFEETTEGFKELNRTFKDLRDSFVNSGEAGPDGIWEIVEANPPVSDHYYYTVSAEVTAQTDKYVSIKQTLDMYLGGIRGSEITCYNYRTDTGGKLLLTDLLEGTEGRIKRMSAAALEAVEPYARETGMQDRIVGWDISEFQYYIKDGSIYVCFDPYDVYDMSYGPMPPVEARLPALLKEEWQ